ncbi:HupE/UreJ family protein [Undibacterium pigrum]|uniref:Urease accessory protein n=1 Tax=Undibacterium pigrum TaxID=401470 RepID=A0A318JHZ9_9BURK|nr:HupE/UreJ family protein [Undibacterium pigrum]PXX46842.1 urease accessory protein [Undibacterium pigrum]
MKLNKLRSLYVVAVLGSAMISLPAQAHDSVLHSMNALQDGFLHPFTGLDHLLAMLAIGIWAAQQKHARAWLIPASFPLMMVVGGALALAGIALPGVEHGIAASVLVLGLLISFAVKLPVSAGVALVSVFAMVHGYAHGQEMPVNESAVLYGAGFVLATALIHAAGWFASNAAQKTLTITLPRYAGVMITLAGAFFLSALA